MSELRLLTLNPGHFHAALVQKEMYPGVSQRVHVYGPLGADLIAHLQRVANFNARSERPTSWELEVHAGPDAMERMVRDKPGTMVVLAGRNRAKMAAILACVQAGLHVLADKPWILTPDDLPKLTLALECAERNNGCAYDIMTERFEITSLLQRALVQDQSIFGKPVPGSSDEPGVFMESVHYLKKNVAGTPLRRPPWFFDIHEQGEGLSDVGTHLVDLVPWILFPDQPIDASRDIQLHAARRWPTVLTRVDFQQVTGEHDFPPELKQQLLHDKLDYYCNTWVHYALRAIHVQLNVLWDVEAHPGAGDTHLAVFRGTRSRIEVRQGPDENFRPEVYVIANQSASRPALRRALENRVTLLQVPYPGVDLEEQAERFRVFIPDAYRVGHEAHFAEVTRQFLSYVRGTHQLPAWEKANMEAKYKITTGGVALSRS